MNKKTRGIWAALLISSAFWAIAAQPAVATPIDLTLESFSFSYSNVTGSAPHIADNGTSVNTSNAGNVTTASLPYTFAFTGTGASLTPTRPLFVVEPQNGSGTSTATIKVTFDFQYDGTNLALPENVLYYANANNDTDTLIWQAGTNGICNGSTTTSHCTYDFTIASQKFSIEMDNETDWNMAEFDAATVNVGPVTTVPEPFTLSLFGACLVGAVAMRRRKAKA